MKLFLTPLEACKQLGSLIAEARLQRNLSQKQLAKNAGISLAALRQLEQRGKISLDSLMKILVVLDLHHQVLEAITDALNQKSNMNLDELLQVNQKKRLRASSRSGKK